MFDWMSAKQAIGKVRNEWDLAVLALLQDRGPLRHKNLRQATSVSDRTLSATLKRLVRDGLVVRHLIETEFPAPVVYQVTPAAEELISCLTPLIEWSRRHPPHSPTGQ